MDLHHPENQVQEAQEEECKEEEIIDQLFSYQAQDKKAQKEVKLLRSTTQRAGQPGDEDVLAANWQRPRHVD